MSFLCTCVSLKPLSVLVTSRNAFFPFFSFSLVNLVELIVSKSLSTWCDLDNGKYVVDVAMPEFDFLVVSYSSYVLHNSFGKETG